MSSDHEWRNCFHPTTQQGGDGCHFFMRCHGVWPTLCELPERDHAERDDEQIKRLTAEVERLTRERDEAQDAALGYARALRNVLDMAYRRAHKQIIAHVMAVLGGAADDPASGERDALAAQVAALRPCALALEYRDGVTCRDERDRGVCLNHRVIEGLRVHAVTADRLEIENRALRRQVRATYGIIHEGLHGGRATDPEGQATCERPSCRNARAALAAASEEEFSTDHDYRRSTRFGAPWCDERGCLNSEGEHRPAAQEGRDDLPTE